VQRYAFYSILERVYYKASQVYKFSNNNYFSKLSKDLSKDFVFLILIFILFLLSRLLAAPLHTSSNEFMWDGMLDTCSKSWQFITGQRIEGDDNCYLSFFIHFLTSYTFGYSAVNLQLVTITMSSLAMSLIVISIKRLLGDTSALIFAGLVLTSTAFTGHGILPSNMPTALYGLSLSLFSLSMRPSLKRDCLLSFSIFLVLLGYAAGVVSILPLLVFHFLAFREKWPLKNTLICGFLSTFALAGVWYIRKLVAGSGDLSRWAVGEIGMPDRSEYEQTIKLILNDVFVKADSWYALALDSPYLSLSLSLWLGLCLLLVAFRVSTQILYKRTNLGNSEKWCLVFLGSFIIAILLASINSSTPGIRRIYPSILFLFAILSTLPYLLPKITKIRNISYVLLALILCHEGVLTYQRISSNFGVPEPISWIVAAERAKLEIAQLDKPKNIIIDREYEPALDRVFCNLYLDREIRAKTLSFYGLEIDSEGNVLISKNGANPEILSSKLEGDVLLITDKEERKALLNNALGLKN
jgi:hypothetical protein